MAPYRIMLVNSIIVTKRWANALFIGKGRYELTIDLSKGVKVDMKHAPVTKSCCAGVGRLVLPSGYMFRIMGLILLG